MSKDSKKFLTADGLYKAYNDEILFRIGARDTLFAGFIAVASGIAGLSISRDSFSYLPLLVIGHVSLPFSLLYCYHEFNHFIAIRLQDDILKRLSDQDTPAWEGTRFRTFTIWVSNMRFITQAAFIVLCATVPLFLAWSVVFSHDTSGTPKLIENLPEAMPLYISSAVCAFISLLALTLVFISYYYLKEPNPRLDADSEPDKSNATAPVTIRKNPAQIVRWERRSPLCP